MWQCGGIRVENQVGSGRHARCFQSEWPLAREGHGMGTKPVMTKEDDMWVIRVESASGKMQEYRCATEKQAKQLFTALQPRETGRK
jgi:hypothetical protein